jgi:hypothetical protein
VPLLLRGTLGEEGGTCEGKSNPATLVVYPPTDLEFISNFVGIPDPELSAEDISRYKNPSGFFFY